MKIQFEMYERAVSGSKAIRRYLAVFVAAALLAVSGCDFGNDNDADHVAQDPEHDALDAHDDREDEHEDDGDGHGDHDESEDETQFVEMAPDRIEAIGIELHRVESGPIGETVSLPAQVRFSGNRIAHITPRVTGLVSEVFASEGDSVEIGDILAILDSRELAEAAAEYLSAIERLALADANVNRSRQLRERGVVSEQAYFDDQQTHASAEIEVRAASQKLIALGIDEEGQRTFATDDSANLTRYQITSPIAGTLIERHAVLGEVIDEEDEEPSFVVADASEVWVDIAVYPDQMDRVEVGAEAIVLDTHGSELTRSRISFLAPHISEDTRTGLARLIVNNDDGDLRPGTFVTVDIMSNGSSDTLRVPTSALQTISGQAVVFVREDSGFSIRNVEIGRRSSLYTEIRGGLAEGDIIAAHETFLLKSLVLRSQMGEGHAH